MFEEMTNERRANNAQTAIDAFRDVCRTDECDAICDLLANLLHLARREGLDPQILIDRARMHFEAEESEEAQEIEGETPAHD